MAWKDTLLDAGFKGVGFEVTGDTLRAEHALAEHEYPFVAGADIEDTGRRALEINLTAVLYGDDYEARLQRLLAVLNESGAGELVHPIYGSVPDCVVADYEVRHQEDSPDYAEISVSFRQSVVAAPFFQRELPQALADEADWLAEAAAFEGLELFERTLGKIRHRQNRWDAMHAAVLQVVGRLHAQVGGIFSGSLNLLGSPMVLGTELKAVFGALAGLHRTAGGTLTGWRDLFGGVRQAAGVPFALQQMPDGSTLRGLQQPSASDMAALTALIAIHGAAELAAEAADIFAAEQMQPEMAPAEISRLLADARQALASALAANRLVALMQAANAEQAEKLAALLMALYQADPPDADTVLRRAERMALLPAQPYLEGSAALAGHVRELGYTLQKQAQVLINLRPPLVQKTVPADTSLHLLAFLWYGDQRRERELLRLNPTIRHPNFIARGTILNAYAR